ncbi:MAG: hypothetical protein JWN24_1436 [Phycisphaerales bacterium]|nr:hypothetical protein [Phycisphaerales bacterium]
MQTINPTTAHPESRTGRRRLVVAACIAVALLAGLGVKLWLDHRVPSPDADAGRLSRYMASPAFASLPDAQKAPYLDAFQRASDRGELTPEQQRGVISNVNRSGKNPIQQYFSLPPGKEREKFLDDVIDRVLKEDKLPPPPDKKGAKEIRIDGGRLADSIPPEDRARMNQFMQDLHDRRVARGLPDDGKFLFNRTH